jgi:hypothetical protein
MCTCATTSTAVTAFAEALEKEFLHKIVFSVNAGGDRFEDSTCVECYECMSLQLELKTWRLQNKIGGTGFGDLVEVAWCMRHCVCEWV